MKHETHILSTLGLGLAMLFLPLPAAAQEGVGDEYAGGDYGRVRYQINGLTVLRADTGATSKADLNSPIFPGDAVLTGLDQRTEIQLGSGSLVWIDRDSEVTFLALPDPYASIKDNTVLQLASGALGLTAQLASEEEFRIDTPAATVFLLGDGDFRVEVMPGERVRVTSRRGVAEVVGAGGSVLVRGGTRTEVAPDATPSTPEPFNTFTSDNFDRWIDDREDQYRAADRYTDYDEADQAYEALPEEVRPYYAELSTSGRWTRSDEYGYVWYPNSVARGWRPYRQGYWNYGPHGYFWVSHEPWGWAPYHYGRWAWDGGLGWGWVPGRIFGGAWVAWSWGSAYVGWAPLDYWNRPIYYGTRYYGYYDPYCWSFVAYSDLHYGHHGYYGYRNYHSVHDIGDPLRDYAIVTRPPREAPARLAESTQARERALKQVRESRALPAPDARPTDSFNQIESRVHGKSPVTNLGREDGARTRPTTKTNAAGETLRTPGRSSSMPSYEPRLSSGKPTRATTTPEYRLGEAGSRSKRPATTEPRAGKTTTRTSDPRAIYERMATPRTTREREQSSWGSRRAPARAAQPRPSRTAPAPRKAAPSRTVPSRPKAAPSRKAPSKPKAAPSRTAPSKPKAAPSRSAPSRPKAAPSRSKPKSRSNKSRGR